MPQVQGQRGGCRAWAAAEDTVSLWRDTDLPVHPSFLFFIEICPWRDLSPDEFTFLGLSYREGQKARQPGHRADDLPVCDMLGPLMKESACRGSVNCSQTTRCRSHVGRWEPQAGPFSGTWSLVGRTGASCLPCSPLSQVSRVSSLQVPHRAVTGPRCWVDRTHGHRVPTNLRSVAPWAAVFRLLATAFTLCHTHSPLDMVPPPPRPESHGFLGLSVTPSVTFHSLRSGPD